MDLNYLLHRHQVSLMNAASTDCTEARVAHHGMAAAYASRIRALQADLGADAMLAEAL